MAWPWSKKRTDESTVAPEPAPDSSPQAPAVIDWDALATRAASAGATGMDELWNAVYCLREWHFVPRRGLEDATPFLGQVDGRGFVMAFTEQERAHAFAVKQGLGTDGAFGVLSMQLTAAVEYCEKLGPAGVFGILFNDGPAGFFAPLTNLRPMLAYHRPDVVHARMPASFKVLGLRPSRQDPELRAPLRSLFALPRWFALEDPARPGVPHIVNVEGHAVVLFFTTEAAAATAIGQLGGGQPEPGLRVMAEPTASMLIWLQRASAGPVQYATFDISVGPFTFYAMEMGAFAREFGGQPPAA